MNLFQHFASKRIVPIPANPMPAPHVDAQVVRDFFLGEGFAVFSVSHSTSRRWQVNLRGRSPLEAFGAANRFTDRYAGHRVQVLVG